MLDTDVRYLSQYHSAEDQVLVDYEEDADVSTGSLPGVVVAAQNLALWQEQVVPLKWRDMDSVAALLGWQAPASAELPQPAYVLKFAGPWAAQSHHALTFDLAMSGKTPGDLEDYEVPEEIDFSIAVVDDGDVVLKKFAGIDDFHVDLAAIVVRVRVRVRCHDECLEAGVRAILEHIVEFRQRSGASRDRRH